MITNTLLADNGITRALTMAPQYDLLRFKARCERKVGLDLSTDQLDLLAAVCDELVRRRSVAAKLLATNPLLVRHAWVGRY